LRLPEVKLPPWKVKKMDEKKFNCTVCAKQFKKMARSEPTDRSINRQIEELIEVKVFVILIAGVCGCLPSPCPKKF
jgi:hypothetical protein